MLNELYQDLILDHNRHPRNHGILPEITGQAEGFNPLCGDKVTVYVKLINNEIQDISFVGCGCAISQASASLMTEALKNKTIEEAKHIFQQFHDLLTNDNIKLPNITDKWMALSGVRAFPARVKCATLAWHTLQKAL